MRVEATTTRDGADDVTVVRIHNVGHAGVPAFFLRADVRRGAASGDEVLPIRWSDNDQTIWPGEGLTLTARYRRRGSAGRRAGRDRRRLERRAPCRGGAGQAVGLTV